MQHLPLLEIVGGAAEAVPACTVPVAGGEELRFGDLVITCLDTP